MFWLLISIINLYKELRFLSSVRDSFVVSTGTRANTFEWSQMNNGLVKNRWKSHNRFMRCKLFVFSAACSNYTPSSYCFWTKITTVRNSFESDKISLLTDWVERWKTTSTLQFLHLLYSRKWIEFNGKKTNHEAFFSTP